MQRDWRLASRRARTGQRTAASMAMWGPSLEGWYVGLKVFGRWLYAAWNRGRDDTQAVGSSLMLGWDREPRRARVVHTGRPLGEGWTRVDG